MFNKNNEKLESLIGENSLFRGDIETKGTLRVDGTVEGTVNADWVVLGEKSQVKGNITARGVVVGGKVQGDLRAREVVEIRQKGQVSGDIFTAKLSIVEGGTFDGRSSMQKEDSKIIDLQIKEKAG